MAELKIKADSGGGTVALKGPATTTSNAAVQLTLPVDDGTANQYLKTDGSGALSWATVAVGGATGTDYNDSVNVRFGTDNDMQIKHNGTDASIANNTGNLYIQTADSSITMQLNNGEKLVKAIADGAVELYHDNTKQCETSANGLAFPSGKGIDFSANTSTSTTDAAMTSELLDWYEEGTFTPKVTFGNTSNFSGGSYGTCNGVYTRVGRLVTISFTTNVDAKGSSSGLVHINGLPFASGGSTHRGGGRTSYATLFSSESDNVDCQLYLGDSRTYLQCVHDSLDNLNASDCNSSGAINTTMQYQVP